MVKFPARSLISRFFQARSREPSWPLSHMNTSHQKFTKYLKVRRDLGNQTSPVNRAHMKRPWVYVFFTSSTTWVILSLMSLCVCSFLFGVHLNYKVGIEIQGLPSSNCNFPGILRPWIFNLKFKDFQGACEPWKLQCVLKNKAMISDVLSYSTLCIWRQYEFATLSSIKLVIFRVQLCCFLPYWASNGPL